MKEKMKNEKTKLLFRAVITLSIIFFFIGVADFFFSSKRILLYPTLAVLIFNLITLLYINKPAMKKIIFTYMIILIMYFSFLWHYFYLDLLFVPIFCLLFLYNFFLFKSAQRIILYFLTILSITVMLFLFRENKNTLRSMGDSSIYIGYLRVTAISAIGLLLYYIVDFWLKNKSLAKESTYTIQEKADTVIMADIFEAINRGDGSFMPLFRQLILFL